MEYFVETFASMVTINRILDLPVCRALRSRISRWSVEGFALLRVCVCNGSGNESDPAVVPSPVGVSRVGVVRLRLDRRRKIVDGGRVAVIVVLVELGGLGGGGRRSFPNRALSYLLDSRRRLCIFGLWMRISSWTGAICLSTSSRSICSASPSSYAMSYSVVLSMVLKPVMVPVKVPCLKRFVIFRPTNICCSAVSSLVPRAHSVTQVVAR